MEKKLNIILSPKKLRHYRKVAEKRQFQIADILGVERTTYVGYEKQEELEVPFNVAEDVAKFLNVTVEDLQKVDNVEKVDQKGNHMILNGNYISLHLIAWDEFQKTLKTDRETLSEITKNNTKLTDNNSKLTDSITELVKLFIPPSSDKKR